MNREYQNTSSNGIQGQQRSNLSVRPGSKPPVAQMQIASPKKPHYVPPPQQSPQQAKTVAAGPGQNPGGNNQPRSGTNTPTVEDNSGRVTYFVKQLIAQFFPPSLKEPVQQQYLSYFLRLLSARMAPSAMASDETMLRSHPLKLLPRIYEGDANLNTISVRLQELLTRFSRTKLLNKGGNILTLLYRVSESNLQNKRYPPGLLDSMFQGKETLMRQPQPPKSKTAMEIENNTSSGLYTASNQGRRVVSVGDERDGPLIKAIRKVSNKGNAAIDLNESDLIRDILFVFQGIDSDNIIYSKMDNSFSIRATIPLTEASRRLIVFLAENGWLFKKVADFVSKHHESMSSHYTGAIQQSLCIGLNEELSEYYKLLAVLENMKGDSLSLRKLVLWMSEPSERLKWLAIIVDGCRRLKGGAIISAIVSYSSQGSLAIQGLISRILAHVWSPFLTWLRHWIYFGELNDPFGEFFIKTEAAVANERLWTERYGLNIEMIPSAIDFDLAQKILVTGKSVNFLRRCCGVNDWTLDIPFFDISILISPQQKGATGGPTFRDWVEEATSRTCAKLIATLMDKFSFQSHLASLKKYLLIGQGDFIQYLLDLLVAELNKPAKQLYKHNLLALLETAIRGSNAQYHNTAFLERLDIKLMTASAGDSGWDVFSLDYRLELPLTTIFTNEIMTQYLRLFNFLWRVKRVQHSLAAIWSQHTRNVLQMLVKLPDLRHDVHKVHMLRVEMTHFVDIFFNYIMVEVIESSWTVFVEDDLPNVKDLDELIQQHSRFLGNILDKALLSQRHDGLLRQILNIFDLILRFKASHDVAMQFLGEEYNRRKNLDSQRDEIDRYGGDDNESPGQLLMRGDNEAGNREPLIHLAALGKEYKDAFTSFFTTLRQDDDAHGKLRFLIFRLDFNEYYSNQTPKATAMKDLEEMKQHAAILKTFNDIGSGGGGGIRGSTGQPPYIGGGGGQTTLFNKRDKNNSKDMIIEPMKPFAQQYRFSSRGNQNGNEMEQEERDEDEGGVPHDEDDEGLERQYDAMDNVGDEDEGKVYKDEKKDYQPNRMEVEEQRYNSRLGDFVRFKKPSADRQPAEPISGPQPVDNRAALDDVLKRYGLK